MCIFGITSGGQITFYSPVFPRLIGPDRTQNMGAQTQIVGPVKIQLETFLFVLYYINRTLQLSL